MKHRLLPLYVLLSAVLWAAAGVSGAADPARVKGGVEEIRYYDISSLKLHNIRRELARKGPRGYWAYAQWWVSWTAQCEVTLTLTIDMPRHTRLDDMSPDLRREWQRMADALLDHERMHLDHGRQAAAEIAADKCRTPYAIIDRWAAEDVAVDRRTNHGRTDGVYLP
jgi:predicted secreted Zn-dependent protease